MGCCVCGCLIRRLGGQWKDVQESFIENEGLSLEAANVVNDAFDGLDPTLIVDVHCHLIGMYPEESGCYVHENMDNCCRCQSYAKKYIILQASGVDIDNMPNSDQPYYQRLIQLYENFIPLHIQNKAKQDLKAQIKENAQQRSDMIDDEEEEKYDSTTCLLADNHDKAAYVYSASALPICPKVVLLGLDQVYNKESGMAEPHNTSVYTPCSYVEQIAAANKHIFLLGPSINPYRKDCLQKLIEFKNKGCNIIKWLPNSMGIDPMDMRCDAFYDKLAELDMFLLTHTGHEHSLDDADYTVQEYGNPLRLRRALDKGVKVIMAHCASEGDDADLDAVEMENGQCKAGNACDLFIRMMREEKYEGLLFGDISAITAFKRVGALQKIIQCKDIHHRLIYGSDYPLPAVNGVVWYGRLVSNGLITKQQAVALREIFKYNPILADFISKRIMRYTDRFGNVHQFSPVVFQQLPLICSNIGVNLSVKQKKDQ